VIKKKEEAKKISKCDRVSQFLRWISLGKYHTVLYSKGEVAQSSSMGGVITLIMGFLLISYASYVMHVILRKDSYHVDKVAH
jgi:hypothetical protein